MRIPTHTEKGNPMVPLAAKIPIDTLSPGAYTFEVKVVDDAGKEFKRTTGIQVE
jgi:hypothetical protein